MRGREDRREGWRRRMVLRGIEDDGEKDKDLFCERKKRRMNRRRKLKRLREGGTSYKPMANTRAISK